jgi:hypothetical protein
MMLLLYFIFSNLNELGFEDLGTIHGANFVAAYDVGTIVYLNI